MQNNQTNHEWIDNVKGIGILLVIAGHILSGAISDIIFIFHMPLFFFLGGFLLSTKPFSIFLKKKDTTFNHTLCKVPVILHVINNLNNIQEA
ncbi:acyltransferase family protein [Klebsiella michiganensis]|uniref:acyltransferase family protein n=1 Tax=Klebsiella michiganensis TaxID=1134687 RepID=UPI0012AC417D|nr:acyltransferase family protein [Klebsiella michiganensis]